MHNTVLLLLFFLKYKKIEKEVILNLWGDETVSNGESLFNILDNHLQGELYSHFMLLELRSHLEIHEWNQSCIKPQRLYSAPNPVICQPGLSHRQPLNAGENKHNYKPG